MGKSNKTARAGKILDRTAWTLLMAGTVICGTGLWMRHAETRVLVVQSQPLSTPAAQLDEWQPEAAPAAAMEETAQLERAQEPVVTQASRAQVSALDDSSAASTVNNVTVASESDLPTRASPVPEAETVNSTDLHTADPFEPKPTLADGLQGAAESVKVAHLGECVRRGLDREPSSDADSVADQCRSKLGLDASVPVGEVQVNDEQSSG